MLSAIAKKKLSQDQIREDALTSSVFSPINQFDQATKWRIASQLLIRDLFSENETLKSIETKIPSECKIELWPRLRTSGDRSVEPDAIITFRFDGNVSIAILIEVKWKAPLGEKQLSRQRDAFITTRGTSAKAFQALIVKDISDAVNADASQSDNPESLSIRTWREIYQNLHRIEALSSPNDIPLKHWLSELNSAFRTMYPPPFKGFFSINKMSPVKWKYAEFHFKKLKNPNPIKWNISHD